MLYYLIILTVTGPENVLFSQGRRSCFPIRPDGVIGLYLFPGRNAGSPEYVLCGQRKKRIPGKLNHKETARRRKS